MCTWQDFTALFTDSAEGPVILIAVKCVVHTIWIVRADSFLSRLMLKQIKLWAEVTENKPFVCSCTRYINVFESQYKQLKFIENSVMLQLLLNATFTVILTEFIKWNVLNGILLLFQCSSYCLNHVKPPPLERAHCPQLAVVVFFISWMWQW